MTPLQKRIRQRLEELGLSQQAAALRVGSNRDLIRQVLRADGESYPRYDTITKIAEALDVSEVWLLTGQESGTSPTQEISVLDEELHKKATIAAINSLETAGLALSPDRLSELIILLYGEMLQKHGE